MIRAAQKQNSLTTRQMPQEVGLNMGVAYRSGRATGANRGMGGSAKKEATISAAAQTPIFALQVHPSTDTHMHLLSPLDKLMAYHSPE